MVHGGLGSSSRDCNLIRTHLEQIILEVVSAFLAPFLQFVILNLDTFEKLSIPKNIYPFEAIDHQFIPNFLSEKKFPINLNTR